MSKPETYQNCDFLFGGMKKRPKTKTQADVWEVWLWGIVKVNLCQNENIDSHWIIKINKINNRSMVAGGVPGWDTTQPHSWRTLTTIIKMIRRPPKARWIGLKLVEANCTSEQIQTSAKWDKNMCVHVKETNGERRIQRDTLKYISSNKLFFFLKK